MAKNIFYLDGPYCVKEVFHLSITKPFSYETTVVFVAFLHNQVFSSFLSSLLMKKNKTRNICLPSPAAYKLRLQMSQSKSQDLYLSDIGQTFGIKHKRNNL